jgi:hypothetical protein
MQITISFSRRKSLSFSQFYARALETWNARGVIFAHGSANQILAMACRYQAKCGVKWFAIAGAYRGQIVSTVLNNLRSGRSDFDYADEMNKLQRGLYTFFTDGKMACIHTG